MSEQDAKPDRVRWFMLDIWRMIVNFGAPQPENIRMENARVTRHGTIEKIWSHKPCEVDFQIRQASRSAR